MPFFTPFIRYKFQQAQEKLTEAERAELKDFAFACEILQLCALASSFPPLSIRCSIRVLLRVKKGIDDARLVVEANGGTVNYFTVPPTPSSLPSSRGSSDINSSGHRKS